MVRCLGKAKLEKQSVSLEKALRRIDFTESEADGKKKLEAIDELVACILGVDLSVVEAPLAEPDHRRSFGLM